jgi:putative ABC transport system substrate-binding protein
MKREALVATDSRRQRVVEPCRPVKREGRRAFLIGACALLALRDARAQAAVVRRVAVLDFQDATTRAGQWQVLRQRLRELGYVEGRNLVIEMRWADGAEQRLESLAKELLAGRPEIVLVNTTPATKTLMRLTSSVPIVFTEVADPVATGLVASLARPGGNVTGVSAQLTDMNVKRFELMHEVLPSARRFALFGPASSAGIQEVLKRLQVAARSVGVDMRLLDASDSVSIVRAFEGLRADPLDALLVSSVLAQHNSQIATLAAQSRVPVSFIQKEALDAGGLLVFGPDSNVQYRRIADYVHQILSGAKPGELPVEQPTEFWLGVNLRAARGLGLKIPQSVIVRADEVKE